MLGDAEAAAMGEGIVGSDFQFVAVGSLLEVLFVWLMDVVKGVILLWRWAPCRRAGLMGRGIGGLSVDVPTVPG